MRLRLLPRRPLPEAPPLLHAPRPHIDTPEQFGAELFGPPLFAFMAWLIRHPATARLDRLYFASREGWLLERLYGALRAELAGRGLPLGIYLPCSRRAVLAARLGASMTAAGAGRLEVGLLTESSPWFEGTVEALLLARIGFTPRRPAPADSRRIVLMRDAAIVHCVAELLAGEIVPHVCAQHAGFLAYANVCGLTAGGGAGLVDVGYGATIQSAIQHVLRVRLVGFYMAVTEAARRVEARGGYAFGAFAEGGAAAGFGGAYGLLLEAVLSAPHGQVIGYTQPARRRHASPAAPLFDTVAEAARGFATLERIHAGILSYCLARLASHGLQPDDDPLGMLRRFGAGGISVAAEIRQVLSVEDAFCGNGEIDVLARLAAVAPA